MDKKAALRIAILRSDVAAVAKLLESGLDANTSIEGRSGEAPALVVAAGKGCSSVVKLLLNKKADPNIRNYGGPNALMEAAYSGHDEIVDMLLEHGARLEEHSDHGDGETALVYAIWGEQPECVAALIREGAVVNVDFGTSPLAYAVQKGNVAVVKMLLEAGAVAPDLTWADIDETHPSYEDMVQLLGLYGLPQSDPVEPVKPKSPPRSVAPFPVVARLIIEARRSNDDTEDDVSSHEGRHVTREDIAAALDRDPDSIRFVDRDGCSLLHFAVMRGRADLVEELLGRGIAPDVEDRFGNTPLHCVQGGSPEQLLSILLSKGANIEAKNQQGRTALHSATGRPVDRESQAVEAFLRSGSDIHARGNENETPLHVAAYYGSSAAVQVLCDAGADVNARDNNQGTPLHWAACQKHHRTADGLLVEAILGDQTAPVVKVLLDHGAEINARDDVNSWTPRRYAAANDLPLVHDLLATRGGTY